MINTAADLMRQYLEGKSLTAGKLAEEIGVSPALVSQIMWGKTRVPRRRLDQIADVLQLDEGQKDELRQAFDAIRAPMMGTAASAGGSWGGGRRAVEREVMGAVETLRREVRGQLRQARCLFETDVEYGALRVDFLVAVSSHRQIALLLRHNPDVNKRELIDMPGMVRRYFPETFAVVIIFPYLTEALLELRHLVEDEFGHLATPMNLCLVLHGLIEDFDEGLAFRQGELLRHLAGPEDSAVTDGETKKQAAAKRTVRKK